MLLRLRLLSRTGERLMVGYPLAGRVFYGLLGAILLTGALTVGRPIVPMAILGAVCLAGALWDERWILSKDRPCITRVKGFFPLSSRLELPLDGLACLRLRVVSTPSPDQNPGSAVPVIPEVLRKGRAVLLMEFRPGALPKNGTVVALDDGSHREAERLEALGRAIADFFDRPLYQQ